MKLLPSIPVLFICLASLSLAAPGEDQATRDILARYMAHASQQQEGLRGVKMEMDIDAKLPKLQKTGKFHAFRSISKVGQITYQGLRFMGDNTIKNDVIARYLRAENETKDVAQLAITPANYKFKYKGMKAADGHLVHVFHVKPIKKSVGLFDGEVWLDAQTCLPVRESGRFVKSPSVFLTRMEFIRTYELQNGVSIPQRIESKVDTRFFGPVALSISFSNFAKDPESEAVAFASTTEAQF